MSKKPVNFRLDENIIRLLDSIVKFYTAEVGLKFDRTKAIEKLIMDKTQEINTKRS